MPATHSTTPPSRDGWMSRGMVAGRGRPIMARRSWACAWEDGSRPSPPSAGLSSAILAPLSPLSSAICADTTDRVLSLTFDDGPDPRYTPQVLDQLAAHGARATFFMLSSAAREYPELVRRVVAEGHEVALHGVTHERMTELPPAEALALLRQGKSELEQSAQVSVNLYRPTYGAQRASLAASAHRLGMDTVIWSGWAQDWRGDEAAAIVQRAVRACHSGGILLLHDTLAGLEPGENPAVSSPEMTSQLLDHLEAHQWDTMTVGELLRTYRQVRCPWFERPRRR